MIELRTHENVWKTMCASVSGTISSLIHLYSLESYIIILSKSKYSLISLGNRPAWSPIAKQLLNWIFMNKTLLLGKSVFPRQQFVKIKTNNLENNDIFLDIAQSISIDLKLWSFNLLLENEQFLRRLFLNCFTLELPS